MAEPESGKQSLSFSFDSLADELEGKEASGGAVKNLADNLFDVVYGNHSASVQSEGQSDFSVFGRRLAQDAVLALCGLYADRKVPALPGHDHSAALHLSVVSREDLRR